MTRDRLQLGRQGEDAAVRHLKELGYQIVERNYRTMLGEIDIIAKEKGDLVFVEVKTRSGTGFGVPAESITPRKCRQISKTAMLYLSQHKLTDAPARFDVVSVIAGRDGKFEIEVIRNAFDVC